MSKYSVAQLQRLNGRRSFSSGRRGGRRGSTLRRWIIGLLFIPILALAALATYLYFIPAGRTSTETTYVFIQPGSDYQSLSTQLRKKLWLRFPEVFDRLALWRGLSDPQHPLRPGRYAVKKEMTMLQLIDHLQHGEQAPLTLTPPTLRTTAEVVDYFSQHLWVKRDSLQRAFSDSTLLSRYGIEPSYFYARVLRQPLEVKWTVSAEELLDSIQSNYSRFWKGERTEAATRLGFAPLQVLTLASIVESETAKPEEYRRIAGLYLNRLREGMRLQSDPTVKYALGDFKLQRIRGEHLKVKSPYNTYLYAGLPPSPILLPSIATIDSVLKAEPHGFLYMCAKEDFSGYHNFATTFSEHVINAKRYQEALNKRGIR